MGAIGRVEGEGGPRVSLTNFEFRYTSAQGGGGGEVLVTFQALLLYPLAPPSSLSPS